MAEPRLLTAQEAQSFYDRFGIKQDNQGWYEQPALDDLIAHAGFQSATDVFELGCGTGRFGHILLSRYLPPGAHYLGVDISVVMVGLARTRLEAYPQAEVRPAPAAGPQEVPDGSFDRFVATYVFDLLSAARIREVVGEAHRILKPGGLLCTAGLTPGSGPISRCVSTLWSAAHRINPALVGGCRPLVLADALDAARWKVLHRRVVVAWGIASEVLVAGRL